MHVYVSNKNKYIKAVQNNLGEKTSALKSLFGFRDRQSMHNEKNKTEKENKDGIKKRTRGIKRKRKEAWFGLEGGKERKDRQGGMER